MMNSTNCVSRFLFDDLDVRGAYIRLSGLWRALLTGRHYSPAVTRLLGQMVGVSLLLADNLKSPGRLTLQLRGEGPISLLVVDCTDKLNVRCVAHHKENLTQLSTSEVFGKGQLSLIYDTKDRREPYQSVVPTEGDSVARIFEHYLKQSEQLATRFFLAASEDEIGGFFLQKMPATDEKDSDAWSRLEALGATVRAEELLNLSAEEMLTRLFHDEKLRLFPAKAVEHHFPEDWDKIGNMLRSLGRDEIYRVLTEQGEIAIRDDLSNHDYRFDKAAIDSLFANMPQDSKMVH